MKKYEYAIETLEYDRRMILNENVDPESEDEQRDEQLADLNAAIALLTKAQEQQQ